MERKTKRNIILISSIIGIVSVMPLVVGFVRILSHKNNLNKSIENNSIKTNPNISSFNDLQIKTIGISSRVPNKQVYETEITKKYGNKFKYPGWNFDYEKNQEQNRYQSINGENIDGSTLVFNERVQYQDSNGETFEVKYSDPNFILNEIKNNNLKKHPAANVWFEKNVSNSTNVVNKSFSIPSSIVGITSLGLYVPAGETATIKFSQKTLQSMIDQNINNFRIILNSSFWDNRGPDDTGRISNRYPFVNTNFLVDINSLIENDGIFKFGSPFGGTISIKINSRIKSSDSNIFYSSFDNYDFEIHRAVEMLSYYHTITTKEMWDEQVKKIKNGTITAPAISLDFSYGSTNISSTSPDSFAHLNIDDIVYPYDILEKWTSFLFCSQYFGSRDVNNNVTKLDFEFCDDIWGGAGAWGGGNALYSPLNWARNSFLSGNSDWTIKNNWGTFHEINHNFEQNSALFTKRSHGETNLVTMVNLSLLSDSGRWRNLYNPASDFTNSGWTRLQNMYSTINHIVKNNWASLGDSEYELQNIILYFLGTHNFIDYIRYDVRNNPNTGGFKEIVELSEFFKLNFWPALENFYPLWNNDWPSSYAMATTEEKQKIDYLNKTYKSFDFVANLYAVGSYLYNNDTKKYDYTNDMQAPIDIAAGNEFIFDFDKAIISVNKNFSWSELRFDSKSKNGATLKLDPLNKKKLIYIPNDNTIGSIDEFNVAIIPNKFINRANNYVDQYIWKIKVRPIANMPVISIYNDYYVFNNNDNFYKEYEYMKNEENVLFSNVSDTRLGFNEVQENLSSKWQRAKVSFNFIAPEDGFYNFKIKCDGQVFIVDKRNENEIWWKSTGKPKNWTNVNSIRLKKGETVPFEIYVTTLWNHTKLNFNAIINNNEIDVFDFVTIPWAEKLSKDSSKFFESKYQYKPRTLNYNNFQTSLFGLKAPRGNGIVEKNGNNGKSNYKFISINPKDENIDNKLSEDDDRYFEHWGSTPFSMSFETKFADITSIGSIIFFHRTNNHYEGRPTEIKIKDQDGNILYDGIYGKEFNDRGSAYSILNFDKNYNVTKLVFEMINTKHSTIIFDAIKFSNARLLKTNKLISFQNPYIKFYGDWELIENNPNINISDVNNISLQSKLKNDFLEFELFAQAFDIVGQKNIGNSVFDIYINNKLIETVDTNNLTRIDNAILFSYTNKDNEQLLKIKIVNKSSQLLFLNFIQTYGENVFLKTDE